MPSPLPSELRNAEDEARELVEWIMMHDIARSALVDKVAHLMDTVKKENNIARD